MTEYTPTINEIRADYVRDHTHAFDSYQAGRSLTSEQEVWGSYFDAALAARDAKVAANAWDQGYACGFGYVESSTNPYRNPNPQPSSSEGSDR